MNVAKISLRYYTRYFTLDIALLVLSIMHSYVYFKAKKSKPRNLSSLGFAYRSFNVGELFSLCISPKLLCQKVTFLL